MNDIAGSIGLDPVELAGAGLYGLYRELGHTHER